MRKIAASVLGVVALSACTDVTTYQVELTLEAGQAVVELGGSNKVYVGPGTFKFEQRGPRIDEIEGFRLAVYTGTNNSSNEHWFRPLNCKARCIGLMACDPDDIRIELERWKLRLPSGFDPWILDIGFCTLADGTQSFFGVD